MTEDARVPILLSPAGGACGPVHAESGSRAGRATARRPSLQREAVSSAQVLSGWAVSTTQRGNGAARVCPSGKWGRSVRVPGSLHRDLVRSRRGHTAQRSPGFPGEGNALCGRRVTRPHWQLSSVPELAAGPGPLPTPSPDALQPRGGLRRSGRRSGGRLISRCLVGTCRGRDSSEQNRSRPCAHGPHCRAGGGARGSRGGMRHVC